jgi:hypothetical protein
VVRVQFILPPLRARAARLRAAAGEGSSCLFTRMRNLIMLPRQAATLHRLQLGAPPACSTDPPQRKPALGQQNSSPPSPCDLPDFGVRPNGSKHKAIRILLPKEGCCSLAPSEGMGTAGVLAIGTEDGRVRILDTDTGAEHLNVKGHLESVHCVVTSASYPTDLEAS